MFQENQHTYRVVVLFAAALGCSQLLAGESFVTANVDDELSRVKVELFGPLESFKKLPEALGSTRLAWTQPVFAFTRLPHNYDGWGIRDDWGHTMLVRASGTVKLPKGEHQLLLRSRGLARLTIDGETITTTPPQKGRNNAHHKVDPLPSVPRQGMRPHALNDSEVLIEFTSAGATHEIVLEVIVGGPSYRAEFGETCLAIAQEGEMFHLIATDANEADRYTLTDDGWQSFVAAQTAALDAFDTARRRARSRELADYWHMRHDHARRTLLSPEQLSADDVLPRATASGELVDDYTFLRRLYLDTVGVAPTLDEINRFVGDDRPDKRARWIDRLLQDPRWADNWVGYWQDVLAENPNLLKPTLNNTGPFRWWIHEALSDNKPLDRFATELILMRGSKWGGGTAGFAVASQNDVPMAAKAHVVSSAFLGVQLKCARCHDAPYHPYKQSDLFELASMLDQKPITLPATSSVPGAFAGDVHDENERQSLISVTLQPGTTLQPVWPFKGIGSDVPAALLLDPHNQREQLAARVTTSRRFAEVLANRVWQRMTGEALVEPVDDWSQADPSQPDLLVCLADELVKSGYDLEALARFIFNSQKYQQAAPRRRMSAEQIVDSALHAVGQPMDTEPLLLDMEGTLPADKFLNFGRPQRAWEFTTLANERDRPSLAMPRAQAVVDVLKAFGWRNSRPEPLSARDDSPNLLQPGVLANGVLGTWLTRLTDESDITQLAIQSDTVEQFVQDLYLQMLTRPPTPAERDDFVRLLEPGFDTRMIPAEEQIAPPTAKRFRYVSWSNHLNTEANKIKLEMEALVREGPPATRYLTADWRERAEDAVWALLNSPEMILIP